MMIKNIQQYIGFVLLILLASCSTENKLFERKIKDGKIKATKGQFSGIDYLAIEKKQSGNVQYKLIYDCECGDNRMSLTRYDKENQPWYAVTDSTGNFSFFGQPIRKDILIKPIVFEQISSEEKSLLAEAILKSGFRCCNSSDKPIDKVLGFVKRSSLSTSIRK